MPRALSTPTLLAGLVATLVLSAGVAPERASACADVGCSPSWKLKQTDFSGCSNQAFINPGNDSRINLQLLVQDARAAKGAPPIAPATPGDAALFTLDDFLASYDPAAEAARNAGSDDPNLASGEGSRCVSNTAGAAAFAAAVKAAPGLSDADRSTLVQTRTAMSPNCTGGAVKAVQPSLATLSSAPAREFGGYLLGAAAFYDGDFDAATRQFTALSTSRSPWLRESARYMLARVELNSAQINAFSDDGELDRAKVDKTALAAAAGGLQAYLKAYPAGAYAASARGLMRRVYWLGGQAPQLAEAFGWQFANFDPARTNVSVTALAQEVDNKLGPTGDLAAGPPRPTIDDPLVLASLDLVRMRRQAGPEDSGSAPAGADQLGFDELQAQKPSFASDPALLAYLLAVHRLYLEADPAGAIKLLAAAPAASNLGYSQRVLRGMALEALKDPSARGYWMQQIPAARAPFQRPVVELAVAMNEERGGALDAVFAPDSQVRNAALREILLRNDAAPELLRAQAKAAAASEHERRFATFVLLYKELSRGRDQAFLADMVLVPKDAPAPDNGYDLLGEHPGIGLFNWGGTKEAGTAIACPSLTALAARHRTTPQDTHTLLCLGEFIRVNGLDGFDLEARPPADELGGAPSLFPGHAFSRLDFYRRVMVDSGAPPTDRAYALYRAVNCYAPAGVNSCGGADAAKADRAQWFHTLKSSYASTPWAAALKYYW